MVLKQAKLLALRIGKLSGVFSLAAGSSWRRRRLLILGYHGISLEDEHLWNRTVFIPPSLLRDRLELLRRNRCRVLQLREGVERLFEGTLPERAVALTFDDGTHDFYECAYPLLKQFGYPATVYLTTFYTRVQHPVPDPALSYILWKGRGRKLSSGDLAVGLDEIDTTTEAARAASFKHMIGVIRQRGLSFEEKNELVRKLAEILGVDFDYIRERRILHLMNPEEVRAVAAGGMDVQLHTHRHRTPRDRDLFRRELSENRKAVQSLAGDGRDWHFCYPGGDYDPIFFQWLEELGISSATTCEVDLAAPDHNRYHLPRLIDTGQAPIEFEGWISGVASWLPRSRKVAQIIA